MLRKIEEEAGGVEEWGEALRIVSMRFIRN